jgi:hypothetical protein
MTRPLCRAGRRLPVATGDTGDILVGWLTKIAVTLAIVGLALYDSISIGATMMSLSDEGSYAARAASEKWQASQGHNLQDAYDAAVQAVEDQNPLDEVDPKSFRIDPDGTVHLVVSREATTLVVQHFGFSKGWAHVSREAEGRSVG